MVTFDFIIPAECSDVTHSFTVNFEPFVWPQTDYVWLTRTPAGQSAEQLPWISTHPRFSQDDCNTSLSGARLTGASLAVDRSDTQKQNLKPWKLVWSQESPDSFAIKPLIATGSNPVETLYREATLLTEFADYFVRARSAPLRVAIYEESRPPNREHPLI